MKYYNISCDYEPKITGKKDGAFTVEKKRASFGSRDLEDRFNSFFIENYRNEERVLVNSFEFFNYDDDFIVTYFPRTKSVKALDFMAYGPNEEGIQFLISEHVYNILLGFRLPAHNRIPAKIDTFSQNYYLLGFGTVPSSEIDFSQSTYYNYQEARTEVFKDYEDHKNADYNRITATVQHLFFKKKFEYDIVHTTEGTFASSDVLARLKNENITGFKVNEGVLEN